MEVSTAPYMKIRRFAMSPSQDAEGALQLFALLVDMALEERSHGQQFGVPFAALLRLAKRNRPTLLQLQLFCSSHMPGHNWPVALSESSLRRNDGASAGMFFPLLRSALDSASRFELDGAQVCRVLAAVGQTLQAQDATIRESNRVLAQSYRAAAQQRILPSPSPSPPPAERVERQQETRLTPEFAGEMEFKRNDEQGGALRYHAFALWHASYIGPSLANKSENQDATFAVTAGVDPSSPAFVFALADGVSTSMGSRVAANAIVRRFCEFVMPEMTASAASSTDILVKAARQTQQSLDELATEMLEAPNGYVFDAVRGSSLQSKAAIRILSNTMQPRTAAIPAALTATLIAGIGKPSAEESGAYDIEVLRIGDGVVEQISREGTVSALMQTDAEVVQIAQALGPGPASRAVLDAQEENLETCRLHLQPGETLLISSDGLVRGHQQSITDKLSAILGPKFWTASRGNETALDILRQACRFADDQYEKDPQQMLFADNVSLILIGCGGHPLAPEGSD